MLTGAGMLPPGTAIVSGGRLGSAASHGRIGAAPGMWILTRTSDPGSTAAYPVFAQSARPAVIGVTVCHTEHLGGCRCGLVHLPRHELDALLSGFRRVCG
jgi:hypothetical protein